MQAKALWYVAPGRSELREEAVAEPAAGEVRVRALYGRGLSDRLQIGRAHV